MEQVGSFYNCKKKRHLWFINIQKDVSFKNISLIEGTLLSFVAKYVMLDVCLFFLLIVDWFQRSVPLIEDEICYSENRYMNAQISKYHKIDILKTCY